MPWNYLEIEQYRTGKQHRQQCADCAREWIAFHSDLGPVDVCPGCGSPSIHAIEVRGPYDSTTDPAEIARAFAGIPIDKLREEQANRDRLVSSVEVASPPKVLMAAAASPPPELRR